MYSTTILPNFRKLGDYYPLTEEQILEIETAGGVPVNLEYMSEADYLRVSEGLKTIAENPLLQDHYTELLYLILKQNERMRVLYDAYWQNYEEDLTAREVAKFLLAFKTSNPRHDFHLSAKTMAGNVTVKDSAVSRWMAELIYNNIENHHFPLGIFGERVWYHLFGDDTNSKEPITMERLDATANLKPRKPTLRIKKLYVDFCLYLQIYLINQTHLTLADDVLLSDAQANFFFDVLELIGYINREKVESDPDDYIHAMFRNNIKLNR